MDLHTASDRTRRGIRCVDRVRLRSTGGDQNTWDLNYYNGADVGDVARGGSSDRRRESIPCVDRVSAVHRSGSDARAQNQRIITAAI